MKPIKRFAVLCFSILIVALMTWACNPDVNDIPPVPSAFHTEESAMPTAETIYPTTETANPTADLPVITSFDAADRLMPADLTYLGAFRLPGGEDPPQTFAYGGNAMTFNPDGPAATSSTHPGSLFVSGHDRMAYDYLPDGDQVAEINIPIPTIAANLADLPEATFIQNFADVTAGYFVNLEEIPKVGMQYLNHLETGPLIHLCWGQHLQPENEPSIRNTGR
jgi:hypothetical protein